MNSISDAEQGELARLLHKLTFPVSLETFYAWCNACVTVAIDVILMRKIAGEYHVFLTYREDPFYKGWHIPGSVYLPSEKIEDVQRRVLEKEIGTSGALELDFLSWFDQRKGNGVGENPRGNTVSLSFVQEIEFSLDETATAKFFPLNQIPPDLIPLHIPIFQALQKRFYDHSSIKRL